MNSENSLATRHLILHKYFEITTKQHRYTQHYPTKYQLVTKNKSI